MSQDKKPFDFKSMFNMDPTSQDNLLRGEVQSAFEEINARLSPMIWSLAFQEMEKACRDQVLLSAILNSVVNAAAMFVASTVDEQTFIDDICEKVTQNIRACFAQRNEARQLVATAAPGIGKALLLENAMPGIRKLIGDVANGLTGVTTGLAVVATSVEDLKKG